jgi:hypothetical protein
MASWANHHRARPAKIESRPPIGPAAYDNWLICSAPASGMAARYGSGKTRHGSGKRSVPARESRLGRLRGYAGQERRRIFFLARPRLFDRKLHGLNNKTGISLSIFPKIHRKISLVLRRMRTGLPSIHRYLTRSRAETHEGRCRGKLKTRMIEVRNIGILPRV